MKCQTSKPMTAARSMSRSKGPERAPVLMLSNSLGTNLHMWDEQVGPFTQHFRLVRYDRRGHGKSERAQGPLLHGAARPRRGRRARRARHCKRSIGAACRWAAWSACGSAPMRATASTSLSSPTRPPISPTRRCGRAASSWCAKRAWKASSTPIWSAGSRRGFANARRRPWNKCARCSWPPRSKDISAAARRSATWITGRCCQKSPRRPW